MIGPQQTAPRRLPHASLAAVMAMAGTAFLTQPDPASAQVCLGNPAQERGGTLSALAQFNGGPTSYGAEFRGNLEGPLTVGGMFMLTDLEDVDEDIYTFGGSLSYDIAIDTPEFGLCPVAGVQYSRWDDELAGVEASRSEFRFPVGVGAGLEIGDRQQVALIPSVSGGWYYYTERESLADDDILNGELARDDSGGEFFGEISASLILSPFFVQGAVMTDEWRVDDPVYRISVGVGF